MRDRLAIILVLLAVAMAGCKAAPAKKAEFIGEKGGMVDVPEVKVCHKFWIRADVDWDKFKKIYIPPVNTQYVREWSGWEKMSLASFDEEDFKRLADYTQEAFKEAHRNNKGKHPLKVVDMPDAETLVLEMAITEVVPTNAWLNTVSYAGIMMAVDKGTIALEGRGRDGGTSETILKFADREAGKMSVINIKDITWYSHAKAIIREWADQSVEITNAEVNETIKDSSSFELKVW